MHIQMTSLVGFNTIKLYTDITIPEECAASIFMVTD